MMEESINKSSPSIYRAAVKLLSLQRLHKMDVVFVRHIMDALQEESETDQLQDFVMKREEVEQVLNRMFLSVSQEVAGPATVGDPEELCSLMFRLLERRQTGHVSSLSLRTALIALSADNLLLKYRSLVRGSGNTTGFVSRSRLRSVLQALSQVPVAVQEERVFGSVEAAVSSCFDEVSTPTVSKEHVLSWLQSEPRLLLWLPTLYRLSVSQMVSHAVRCHTCKTFPITGLRYRCKKCVNVHVCQNCYLTNRQTKKHKTHHPVVEFCTQPTWTESLSSLVRNARYALIPRQHTQRDAGRRVLKWVEPGETQNRAPPPSDATTQLADSAQSSPSDEEVSHDVSVRASPPPCFSKSLQTDDELQSQRAAAELLTEVRNLQRDKWLMEQQLQVWRLTVQSEQGVLEDRCSEMEVTMNTLRQHNDRLQGLLTQETCRKPMGAQREHAELRPHRKTPDRESLQLKSAPALNKMEIQQHASNTPLSFNTEHADQETHIPTSDSATNSVEEEEEEELIKEWSEHELQTPSPTMQQDSTLSEELSEVEQPANTCHHQPIGQQSWPDGTRVQTEDIFLSGENDCGKCSPEELLQETVDRLKTEMENMLTEMWTGKRLEAELLEAAEQVGDSIRHLVEGLKKN